MGGYVTFVDEIGTGMQVKEIKGVLIGDQLYTGQILAHALNSGAFGTKEAPTALGDNMVWALMQRLGLTTKETAWELLDKAWNAGQLGYDEATGSFSNYIGWFGDTNGKFLGFWDAEDPTAEIPAGAAYANKCYGMLGSTTSEQTNHASDMMYVAIQVSKPITTGANGALQILDKSPEKVSFRIPASLLPTVTYQIQLDADSEEHATSAEVSYEGADPIRLLYEVGVHSGLTPLNIKEFLREGYKAIDPETGNYYLYTNAWNWEGADDPNVDWQNPDNHPNKNNQICQTVLPDTSKNAITYAYFEPAENNEHYYFTDDMQIYVKNGEEYTPITQVPASAEGTTYYFQHVTYTNKGNGIDRHYAQLSKEAVQAAIDANSVKVPAGTMHYYTVTHLHDRDKTTNATGSYFAVRHHLVDAAINSSNLQEHSYELVYMGNNGRITYAPAQGIQLSKTMNDNSLPEAAVTFDVALTAPAGTTLAGAYQTLHVDAKGNETIGNAAVSGDKVTVSLKPGESIYILDLPTGTTYQVTERKATGYLESTSVGANGTVANNTIKTVSFVNKVRGTGSLSIVKAVSYLNGAVKNDASAGKKFPVTVTLTDGLDDYVGKVTVDGQEKDVAAGQLTFDIVDGQTVLITNIPEGVTYTVAEGTVPEGYAFNAAASVSLTGTVTSGGAAALLANTYTPDSVEINDVKPAITVDVSKTLETHQQNVDFTFGFKLQQFDTAANEWVDVTIGGQKVTTQIEMTAAGTKDAIINLAGLTFDKVGVYDFRVVEDIPTQNPVEAKNGFRGDVIFPAQTYTQADTYYYVIKEADEGKPGYTYDDAVYKVTVTVEPVSGQLQVTKVLVQKDAETAEDVTANIRDNILNGDSITFENTYKAELASVIFTGNKTLNGWNIEDDMFTFVLKNAVGGEIARVENVGGSYTFPQIDYIVETTSTYTISEVRGDKNGFTYDETVYHVTVEVTDNGAGQLETKVTYTKNGVPVASPDFVNSYKAEETAPVVLGGFKELLVDTTLFTRVLKDGDFSFVLKDEDGNEVETVRNVGNAFTFTGLTFDKADTYKYTISEVVGSRGGVEYDDETVYYVTVTVSDLGSGKLTAEVRYATENASVDPEDVIFTNRYTAAEAKLVLAGRKIIVGRDLQPGEVEFVLLDSQGKELDRKTNDEHGNVTFDELKYQGVGVHEYTISEVKGNKGGVTYDASKYRITVEVTDEEKIGQLEAKVTYEKADSVEDDNYETVTAVSFHNIYKAKETSVSFRGVKVLDGGLNLKPGDFTFILKDKDGMELQTVKNGEGGRFAFQSIEFTAEGTYVYTLEEKDDGKDLITYDTTKYTLTVTVVDENGELKATTVVTKGNETVTDYGFTNIYTPEDVKTLISVQKILNNKSEETMGLNGFIFQLVEAEAQEAVTATSNAEGKAEFELSFSAADVGKTFTYKLSEKAGDVEGMTYDDTVYEIKIVVSQNADTGELVLTVTQDDEAVFTNVYEPVSEPEKDPEKDPEKEPEKDPDEPPKTADGFNMALWGTLCLSAAVMLAVLVIGKKQFAK